MQFHDFSRGPFPLSLRASDRAAFHEAPHEGCDSSRYVVLRADPYLDEKAHDLLKRGFTLEELYPNLHLLGRSPKDDARWLYTVESFTVERRFLTDQESFCDHSENYKIKWFDDYDEVLEYCLREYGISESDFKKQWETSYIS